MLYAILSLTLSGKDSKKTQKTPEKEIDRAEALRKEYYNNKKK